MSRIAKAAAVTAAAGAVLAGGAGMAMADAGAQGAAVGSPGVLSGNLIQVPVHVPVNVCGNTVDVIGLLNPAFGNQCTNASVHGVDTAW
ncbi:chaplin [Streptomyces sp. V4-01]|uniref:Chaplin n=1 Tax=Actinacidiphila polyblastidii TaxID=3110430 RepID=A0ABU7P5Z6_9ACTN|nr:chaplin [Streptomyces sp. V4-01]